MSILCTNDKGWVISHYDYSRNLYRNVHSQSGRVDLAYNENLFNIITPLMKDQEAQKMFEILCVESSCSQTVSRLKKRPISMSEVDSEVRLVHNSLLDLIQVAKKLGYFKSEPSKGDILDNNTGSRNFVNQFYEKEQTTNIFLEGGNNFDESQRVTIGKKDYVVPPRCYFVSSDVNSLNQKFMDKNFDFILLDPPWKNKFVKRKKMKCIKKGYQMMSNESIAEVPVDKLLNMSGLVGVWCTNSVSHIDDIKKLFFPRWGLEYVATWFWLKVTTYGEPVCSFTCSNGKKPYERILFASRPHRTLKVPEENKCIISVPSAIHSHKPPLIDVLQEYLPENSECLELFARYLLPRWTSVGNQVLLLQSIELYDEVQM